MAKRAAFFICGVMTVLIGRAYSGLQRFAPTQEIAWGAFSYSLLLVGTIAVVISLLPPVWFQRIGTEATELRRFTPFRFLLSFAAFGFLLVLVFSIAPLRSVQPPIALVYSLCPACVLTVTVDPSLSTALFVLAPLNALAFGAIGGVIGTVFGVVSR
jgi:hypothetical protein